VVAGQYLAFTAILAVSLAIAFGASFLPEQALPYLGLLPIGIGLRDAWKVRKNRQRGDTGEQAQPGQGGPTVLKITGYPDPREGPRRSLGPSQMAARLACGIRSW